MSRNPRSTTPCRPPPSRPGTAESGAGVAAVAGARGACLIGRPPRPVGKSSIPKRGPPPAPPKKVDYKRPQMTRAMVQRLKHTQKLQEEQERRERERAQGCQVRRPRRMQAPPPPPMGTERDCPPRMSRDRRPAPSDPCDRRRPASAKSTGGPCADTGSMPPTGPACPPTEPIISRSCAPRSSAAPPPCPPEHTNLPDQQQQQQQQAQQQQQDVPAHTLNLAKSMNADIVQAEPLQRGLIDNLIIPPGAINSDKTTIVSIPQPDPGPAASSTLAPAPPSVCHNQAANRSVQLISETLDEQDATEAAIVNTKLQDLQQARRDFVMAVATVGTNAINLMDEEPPANFCDITPIADISPPDLMEPHSPYLLPCRDPETDPYLQPVYGRHHPVVESARDYLRTRGVDRYNPPPPALDDDLFLDDDAPDMCPPFTRIPPRRSQQRYHVPEAVDIDGLERFCDLQNYPPECLPTPPSQHCPGPPPGREKLPPDLWEIDDPWYREEECPDLIDWRSY